MELHHALNASNAEIQRIVTFKESPKCKKVDPPLNLFLRQ